MSEQKKEELDAQENVQYNKKAFSFQHNNFPSENETGSEAHRLAVWWANDSSVVAGDQTLISMNDKWYLVEKFDDADNGYQVEERYTIKQYDACIKEWNNGKNEREQSVQKGFNRITSLNKRRSSIRREEYSFDSSQARHGREDNTFQRLGREESKNGQTASDGARNSQGSGTDKQSTSGLKFSLKEKDKGYQVAVQNGNMELAQKLVDDAAMSAGYTLKVYHGSRHLFNEFSKESRGSNTHTKVSSNWFFAGDEETANSYYPYGTMKYLAKNYPNMFKDSDADKIKEKGKLYSLYLKAENPLEVDAKDYDYASHHENMDAWVEYVKQADKNGNDCIILYNALDNQLKRGERTSTVYMFRESSQVKATDPITYDDNGNIVSLQKRFDDTHNDIRFSRKNSQGDQQEVDNGSGRAYNDLWRKLSKKEQAILYKNISELHNQNYAKNTLPNGNYLFSIGNKIIESNGRFSKPSIEGIVEFNQFSEKISEAEDYFYEQIDYGRTVCEGIKAVNAMCKETVATLYGHESSEQNRQRYGQGQDYSTTREDSSGNGERARSNSKDRSTIKFSRKSSEPVYRLTQGQLKKIIANNTKYKVYTKADSELIINNVLSNYMDFGSKYGELSGKTKSQVIDMLWKGLNTADRGYQMDVALDIADYIIQNGVLENIYEEEDIQWAVDAIDILKPYLHSLDLQNIKGDIKHHYDKDNSPYLLWGKRRGTNGIAPDQLGQYLEEVGLQIDATNGADIFIQIDELYRSARGALKKKAKTFLTEGLSKGSIKELRQEIAKEVLRGFDYTGGDTKLANIVKKYTERIAVLKKQLQDERTRNSVINRLLDKVQKLKDIKLETFLNATEYKSDLFKGSINKLANIKYRGDLNKAGTRKILGDLAEWYVESNPILENVYEEDIAISLNEIASGEGKLETKELLAIANIVDYFKHFVEMYNKILINGEYVEAQPIAEKHIKTIHDNKRIKVGWFNKATGSAYTQTFADPMTVARRMDMYEHGFYTDMLEQLRESAVGAEIDAMEIRTELDAFLSKNGNYLKDTDKRTIKYLGKDVPIMDAMYVYMALGRKHAQLGLEESGFTFVNKDEVTVRINGFGTDGHTAESARELIFNQLTALDKQYIEIARTIFNEDCKERKKKTDIARRGYSNITEEEYIPIRRANISHGVDTSAMVNDKNRVSNASFNKDIVKGAKQELYVEPLNNVLDRHVKEIAQYANMATTIDAYDKIFSLDVSGNKNKPMSIATESKNTWKDGNKYFAKLISDMQGIPVTQGAGNKAMAFVRSGYAKYQLGANPKVWLTQLSSFASAGSMLDVQSIIGGIAIDCKDVDEYCPLAKLRNKDNTAAKAQGVLEKVDKVGDFLMKPIGKVDRLVIQKLFGACQVQVEKDSGIKVGTKENKVKAGELLKQVILETQQNSMATERSSAMRSGSEFMKTITMFSADAMKVIGRVIDSIGELSTLKARKNAETDPKKITELDKRIKQAQQKTAKAVASLVTSAVFMALIAQLFRTLYNKDDEEESVAQNMAIDAIGNLLGGLPGIRDVYSRMTEGYDVDGYAYSALNDLLDSGAGIFDTVGDIFSGKSDSKGIALNIKKLAYASGQILGLPTRNLYNVVYGLTKRISPSSAYKIDELFYNQSYSADLSKAIDNEDDAMIATITGVMLNENVGDIEDAYVRKELNELVSKGYSVLPRSIGNKITYNDEEITLTNKQKKQFKAVYSEANSKVASLVELSQYEGATAEVRAKAVKYIYDMYYNLALEDLLGVDLENKNLLFAESIDIEKLAIITALARNLTADKDDKGNTISGTKKAKVQSYVNSLQLTAVQKYMIMGYLGYSNLKGETQVQSYIQRLDMTKTQKAQLFAYSGY